MGASLTTHGSRPTSKAGLLLGHAQGVTACAAMKAAAAVRACYRDVVSPSPIRCVGPAAFLEQKSEAVHAVDQQIRPAALQLQLVGPTIGELDSEPVTVAGEGGRSAGCRRWKRSSRCFDRVSPRSCMTPHRSPAPTHSCDASALIWDVFWWLRGPLRATTRVRGHPRVGESRKWASHALCGAFLAGFRVRTPQSAWHAPEDLSRASERIRRISRQMCRNRLLPVVVWVRFGVEALVRQL